MRLCNLDRGRIARDIDRLSQFTDAAQPGHTRISFSDQDRQAREHVAGLMRREAGLSVRIDPAGNLMGRRAGNGPKPAIVIGSHLDTVRGGGRFDGIAGVVAGLEIARRLEELNIRTKHPLEVVVFTAEEPSPFGISCVGSRAMAGDLPGDLLVSLRDPEGRALGQALTDLGGDPDRIAHSKRAPGDILAFLELHIEQGPLLFTEGIPVGVVTGVVGIYRGSVVVHGRADHAGTTPMEVRADALSAAAEAILAFEEVCRDLKGLVGTIGTAQVSPGAPNVVPGEVRLGAEIRSLEETACLEAASRFEQSLKAIEVRRPVKVDFQMTVSSNPVFFNADIVDLIGSVCHDLDIPHIQLPSGAGHDAGHLAKVAPTGMVFVPSKDGRSHCPEEWSETEHLGLGAEVLCGVVAALDQENRA